MARAVARAPSADGSGAGKTASATSARSVRSAPMRGFSDLPAFVTVLACPIRSEVHKRAERCVGWTQSRLLDGREACGRIESGPLNLGGCDAADNLEEHHHGSCGRHR